MKETVYVYTEQEISPRFLQVIKAITDFPGLHNVSLQPLEAKNTVAIPPGTPIVVFGNITNAKYNHTNNIYTYSPAQVLTKANAATVVGAALLRATGRVPDMLHAPLNGIHVVHYDAPNYEIVEELEALFDTDELVVDIEVSGNIRRGTPEDDDVKLLTVAFYNPEAKRSVVFQCGYYTEGPSSIERVLTTFFEMYEGKLIYHNGKFDVRVLNRILGTRVRVDHDTMLMHHVLNQAAGMHGLKQLCQVYFGAPEWEAEAKKYTKQGGHYENIPFNLLANYNGLDVYWTYQLYLYLKPQIDGDDNAQRAYELELAAAEFLLRVEERGIPFDHEAADKLEEEGAAEMEKQLAIMRMLTHVHNPDFNPASPKQVKEALAFMGEEVSGTSVEILEALQATLDKEDVASMFIDSLLKYRKAAKINSTYVKGWRNKARNGLVHPTYLVHGTSTGRLSSTSPNAQNVPRDKKVRSIVGI